MLDLIVRGGEVVRPEGAGQFDLGVQEGRIAAVAAAGSLDAEAAREIDARGLVVLPGGIEPHAHLGEIVPEAWAGARDVYTQGPLAASRAALFGGTTTIIDFATAPGRSEGLPPATINEDVERRRTAFAGQCYTDYAFHYVLRGEVGAERLSQVAEAVAQGNVSFKVFMTFPRLRVPDGYLAAVFEAVGRAGGMMVVHGENDEVVRAMTERLKREGRDQASNLHLVHNNLSEALAFQTTTRIAAHHGAGVYFVHTTAREGVDLIAEARAAGQPVYGEALHNYLEFTAADYAKPEGMLVHTYPALKGEADRDALVEGLMDGRLSTVGTDEYTTSRRVKLHGTTIETAAGGHNGIETRLAVAWTKFVAARGMSLERFAGIVSSNAARILGLYPRKGAVAVGSDADLVLMDPSLERTITVAGLHAETDYSIWDGFPCTGYPVMTILRGKVVVEDGKLRGDPSDGEWLRRKVAPEILSGPAV